jgi:alkylation response protein AidB-like acyl-CoA dehydrogenase
MDVTVPLPPPQYDAYRRQLRAFIAAHKPNIDWGAKVHVRVPDSQDEIDQLRRWVADLYDAGYVLERFREDDVDAYEQEILEEELSTTGIPHVLGNALVAGALKAFGSPEQKETHLPPMARGDHIWTQLFSEPNAGSDLTALQTRATLEGDTYVIQGQKVWSTWAMHADFGFLLARTEPDSGAKGITAFILDMHADGIDTRPLREMTGSADFNEVFFDEVRVPAGNVIGTPGQGWMVANTSLALERGGVGQMNTDEAITALVQLAQNAPHPAGAAMDDSAVRQAIGAVAARSRIQRYLGHHVATKTARGQVGFVDLPLLKIWASELNLDISELALELQGPAGILAGSDPGVADGGRWQDMFLYARALTIAGGTNEVMRNVIAERGLGLPREPRGS